MPVIFAEAFQKHGEQGMQDWLFEAATGPMSESAALFNVGPQDAVDPDWTLAIRETDIATAVSEGEVLEPWALPPLSGGRQVEPGDSLSSDPFLQLPGDSGKGSTGPMGLMKQGDDGVPSPDGGTTVEDVIVTAQPPDPNLFYQAWMAWESNGHPGAIDWTSLPGGGGTAEEECSQESTADDRIDDEFIAEREGAAVQEAYPPPSSDSGVTVGTGVDLGQRNSADLASLDLSADLVSLLTPYLGLRGQAAADFLDDHPLILTPGQVAELDRAVHNQIYTQLATNYNNASDLSFWRLPSAVQTVIASVALQYGPNLHLPASEGGTPSFWAAVTEGRWQDAVDELRDFGDAYSTRRNLEADVLEAAIDEGDIPPTRCDG